MKPTTNSRAGLGLWSGVGVNMSTMIGVGVFLSAGFMAGSMGPGLILLSWLVGGVLAMAGARAYAAVATLIPRSGGEYRYLSDLFHPWLGYLAGWTSLLAGFSAPVAINASAAGAFSETLSGWHHAQLVATVIIVGSTLLHALDVRASKWTQDLLAIVKVVLVGGFIVVGVAFGKHSWPTWTPAHAAPGGDLSFFMAELVFVMYGYSGWNSSIYASDEFVEPKKNVPRAMLIATAAVMVIYLLVNWVLVANITPHTLATFDGDKVTLGHAVVQDILGDAGGKIMSVLIILLLLSGVSAMTMVGPRVYEAMARDGFLPRAFVGSSDRPPLLSVFLQGALALVLVFFQSLERNMESVSILLTATSILTVLTLFKVQFDPKTTEKPGPVPLICSTVFTLVCGWMLYSKIAEGISVLLWPGILIVAATISYLATKYFRRPVPA